MPRLNIGWDSELGILPVFKVIGHQNENQGIAGKRTLCGFSEMQTHILLRFRYANSLNPKPFDYLHHLIAG